MKLHPFQEQAKAAVLKDWSSGIQRTLLVLPTGTGKTIVFSKIIEDLVRDGKRVLVLAHRGELLEQAADKLHLTTGLKCAVEKADQTCIGEWFRVVVGSVQTLMSERRRKRFRPDYFGAIIVDEAHHVLAQSYRGILDYFSEAKVLGVTATPDRGDLQDLGKYFENKAYEYLLPQAIKDGYLSPIRALSIPLEIDLTGVKITQGDFNAAALGGALVPYLEAIADAMVEHCQGRKTLLFLPLIATSVKMRDILADRGFSVGEVNGESKDRTEILQDFAEGRYECLCNSMLLTEGYDCPAIDCIVPLRATKIRSLFCQMVGRGTRIHPGKDYLLLMDFLWNTARHDLCRPAHLIAKDEIVAQQMTKDIAKATTPVDLEQVEIEAESECVKERERGLAEKLEKLRKKKGRLVDPIQYELSILDQDLASYVPAFGWEKEAPSVRQREALDNYGIDSSRIDSAGKASRILETLSERTKAGLARPKQIQVLERMGFRHVGEWSKDSAQKMIARCAAQGWRVPHGIDPYHYAPQEKNSTHMII